MKTTWGKEKVVISRLNVLLSSKTSCSEEDFTSVEPLQAVKGHSIVDEIRKVDFTL